MPSAGPELTQACLLPIGRLRHRPVPEVSEVPATTINTTAAAAPTLTSTTSASPHTIPTVGRMTENMALLTIR